MRARGLMLAVLGLGCAAESQGDPASSSTTGSSSGEASDASSGVTTASTGPAPGSSSTSAGSSGESGSSSGSTGEEVDTWGEPVDCENHRPTGPSTFEFTGTLDGVESSGACDFLHPLDWVNFCDNAGVGFLASCSTETGMLLYLQVAPPTVGELDDPNGDPRFVFEIRNGTDSYSAINNNATHTLMTVTAVDPDARRIAGTFEGAWYDLTVSGLRYPDGGITGTFDIAF